MFTYECVLAATLLSSPVKEIPVSCETVAWAESVRASLISLALQAEIVDPRENNFFLAQNQDPASDLRMLQGRYMEFAGAPVLEECNRFPVRALVNDFLSFNRSYRNDLNTRLGFDQVHAEEIRTAIMETDRLYQIWDAVRDSRCDYYYVTVRRQALSLLRDQLGAEAFYRGTLPPHVPVWHFAERN